MEEDDDQEIYDDGTSITNTNKRSVGRIKSMFEPALEGPKPPKPMKPATKPAPPKRSEDPKPMQNGSVKPLPPKRSEDTKVHVQSTLKNNIFLSKDENSNVTNKGSDVNLNPEIVSKFNSIRNKLEGSDKTDRPEPLKKPPWQKPMETSPKPLDTKRTVGKLPMEGTLASRVKSFQKDDGDNDTSSKPLTTKPLVGNKVSGIAEKIASISANKPPLIATSETKTPPPPPTKPVQQDKPVPTPTKPKTFSAISPTLPVSGDNEFLMKIRKRKESIDNASTGNQAPASEPKQLTNGTTGGNVTPIQEDVQLRGKSKHGPVKHRKSVTRVADNKKFFLVEFSSSDTPISDKPPPKPAKLPHVDLDAIVSEYKKAFLSTDDTERPLSQGVIEEDIYEELPGEDEDDFPLPPPPSSVPGSSRPISNRVSFIPEMTEEEEIGDDVYDEGFSGEAPPPVIPQRMPPRRNASLPVLPPLPGTEEASPTPPPIPEQETYENNEDNNSDGELYEPLDEIASEIQKSEEGNSAGSIDPDDSKAEQLSEKERKKREKEREKEEKKRQEEEKKKLEKKAKELKRYKIEAKELEEGNTKGSGIVKEDTKGKGKEIPLKKDQRVIIICIDKRVPSGKWLIMLEEDKNVVGLVDSNSIEVDNTMIKTVMQNSKKPAPIETTDDQEEYEAVDQDEVYAEPDA